MMLNRWSIFCIELSLAFPLSLLYSFFDMVVQKHTLQRSNKRRVGKQHPPLDAPSYSLFLSQPLILLPLFRLSAILSITPPSLSHSHIHILTFTPFSDIFSVYV